MWIIKTFDTRQKMLDFVQRNKNKIEWHEVFINKFYGIEYRKLRKL